MPLGGYKFRNPSLRDQALTHRKSNPTKNNETLEFLGDRVLNMIVAEMLLEAFPADNPGFLTLRLHSVTSTRQLANIASKLELSQDLRSPKGRADAYEAYTAAVYLDGGWQAAKEFVTRTLDPITICSLQKDSKSELHEYAAGRGLALPVYQGHRDNGSGRSYHTKCTFGKYTATAVKPTRREAEMEAARSILTQLAEDEVRNA